MWTSQVEAESRSLMSSKSAVMVNLRGLIQISSATRSCFGTAADSPTSLVSYRKAWELHHLKLLATVSCSVKASTLLTWLASPSITLILTSRVELAHSSSVKSLWVTCARSGLQTATLTACQLAIIALTQLVCGNQKHPRLKHSMVIFKCHVAVSKTLILATRVSLVAEMVCLSMSLSSTTLIKSECAS